MPDDNYDIFVIRPDGSDRKRLTTDPGWDDAPSVSPDGEKIAFSSERSGRPAGIFLMSPDGTNVEQVTPSGSGAYDPSFSPDAEHIVFVRSVHGTDDIWSMNADGSDPVQLTDTRAAEAVPSYSSIGDQIAFEAINPRSGGSRVKVMDADGSNPVVVSHSRNGYSSYTPEFAPVGDRLAYTDVRAIRTVSPDGTNPERLLKTYAPMTPTYSPDGSQIAFTSGGPGRLRISNSDGSGVAVVPNTGRSPYRPDWGSLSD